MNLYPPTRLSFRNSFVIIAVYLLSACGGSDEFNSTDNPVLPDELLIGTFVDSAVSGLHYATNTQSGITNEAGEFLFYPGESITFNVGSVQLPSAPASLEMTPLDLAGTDQLDSTVVVNILQFLQTLDDDQNAENGIQLETASASISNLVVDFTDENFSTQEAVQKIVKIAPSNTNNRLIDADVALEHFGSSLIMLADPPSSANTNTTGAGDEFYIVYGDNKYNGDMIIFSRKHFALTSDGQLSDGKYNASSNVWHLWNREQRQHQFVMVSETIGGSLETCWANTAKKAVDCNDEDATIAYLFPNETDAQSFNSIDIEISPEPIPATSTEPVALPMAERESVSLAVAQAESIDAVEAAVVKTEDQLLVMQQAIDAEAEKEAARLAAERAEADANAAAEATAAEELVKIAAEISEAEELEIARLAKVEEESALAAAATAAEELEAAIAAEEEKAAQLASEKLAAEQAAAAKAAEEQKAAELAAAKAATEIEAAELAAKTAAEEEAIAITKAQAEQEAAEAAAAQARAQAEAASLAAAEKEAAELAAKLAEEERIAAETAANIKAEEERLAAEQTEADRLAAEQAEADRLAAERAAADFDPLSVSCSANADEVKRALLELTNDARAAQQVCGSTSYPATTMLQWDDSLAAAARSHSLDMATHNFFSHTGSDGLSAVNRAAGEGFPSGYVGENIAAGQTSTGTAQSGWMNSEGHCVNIMRPNYTHMGAACVAKSGTDYSRYWTVVFGRIR